jgi:hypothetical protein
MSGVTKQKDSVWSQIQYKLPNEEIDPKFKKLLKKTDTKSILYRIFVGDHPADY